MATNYKQTTIAGESWVRAGMVTIRNPYNKPATAQFMEQKLILADGVPMVTGAGMLNVTFDTNNPLHLAAYMALDAVYTEARELRDNAND